MGFLALNPEAIRAALANYFLKLGLLGRKEQWDEIRTFPRRKISPEQLAKDLEKLEEEVR